MVTINGPHKERSPFTEVDCSGTGRPWTSSLSVSAGNTVEQSHFMSDNQNESSHRHGHEDRSANVHHRPRSRSPEGYAWSHRGEGDGRRRHRPYELEHQTPEYWERRRQQRERAGETINARIWPPSPPKVDSDAEVEPNPSEKDKRSIVDDGARHSGHSDGGDSSTDSSEKSTRKRSHRHHRRHHHHSSETGKRKHRKRKTRELKKKHKKKYGNPKASSSESGSESHLDSDEEEDEKKLFIRQMQARKRELEMKRAQEEEEVGFIGPLLPVAEHSNLLPLDYGRALLPGEGAAMAAYIAEGKRIPRRGEIGLTSDEIEKFEAEGYVMSGSRHRRMEAVRLRKENQIYSADEKRALEHFNYAERAKREAKLQAQFKALIKRKLEDKQSAGGT
ncbi:unnamed protein product [Calicophoron daubneyi]|uniref:NF-kappa-B-activating protein C-terminal domain-containing protein n=1 Tax=Calicophoron daubneyi TaxID=300641 RepID=A0AAV2TXZ8_CALDB